MTAEGTVNAATPVVDARRTFKAAEATAIAARKRLVDEAIVLVLVSPPKIFLLQRELEEAVKGKLVQHRRPCRELHRRGDASRGYNRLNSSKGGCMSD